MNTELQTPEPKSDSLLEHQVDAVYDSLPDTTPVPVRQGGHGLLDKLRRIAAKEGFEVEEMLGQGGMGAVVSARDKELGRKVALKFLVNQNAEHRFSERLKREAERASSLAHENIVQVYSWHSVGNLTFFSMEYVDGETLNQYLKKRPHVPHADVLRIMAEAAAGVAAAHDAGLLHRDIKPQNILIGRNGRVKVTDFGLASEARDRRRANSLTVSGTLGFMAPEQARGAEESFSSDVFSLTATLYYALTNRIPYEAGDSSRQLLLHNQEGRVVPLFTVREDLPQTVYRIVARGLSTDPARRFPNARAFRAELENVLLNLDVGTGIRGRLGVLRLQARRLALPIGLLVGFAAGFALAWYLRGLP
jgi:serine/threonine-protein kinase